MLAERGGQSALGRPDAGKAVVAARRQQRTVAVPVQRGDVLVRGNLGTPRKKDGQ